MNRKPYVRPVSTTRWYWSHPRYLLYMSREVTCIFIGAFAVFLVCLLARLSQGQAAYESFLTAITGTWGVVGFLLVLAFAVHNTTSWFNVTPKAMPVQIGEAFLAAKYIIAAHYLGWLLVSLAILYFAGVW